MGFLLIDCQREIATEESNLLEALHERSYPVEILLTKADKLKQSERHEKEKFIRRVIAEKGWENLLTYRFVSVKSGEGMEALQRVIYQYEKNFF
jgi:GTP-binding protein EngB required for normal cell division